MSKQPSKTDCARWLNEYGHNVNELAPFFSVYLDKRVRGGKPDSKNFGHWLRTNHNHRFEDFYEKKFLGHGEEALTKLYKE